jgi:formate dehydrogenase gamma subunit
MSEQTSTTSIPDSVVLTEKVFIRFRKNQIWEHWILLISFSVLLLTGLPQKYRTAAWSQNLLSTPERLATVQTIHHIAAVVMILLVLYHLGRAIVLMARRSLPGDILITWQDVRDAGRMMAYLLFLRNDKPPFGKYNFEQKVTYWFFFLGIAIMVLTGLILWYPEIITRLLPGSIIPAAKLAHSTEAIVALIFLFIWHFYHVHLERLNLSIFTGKMTEVDMQTYHKLEYDRLTAADAGQGQTDQP